MCPCAVRCELPVGAAPGVTALRDSPPQQVSARRGVVANIFALRVTAPSCVILHAIYVRQ